MIFGCKDPAAVNYNSNSIVVAQNSTCLYKTQNLVCADPNASNYSSSGISYPAKCIYGGLKQNAIPVAQTTVAAQSFTKNLKQGMHDPQVSSLEQFLDTHDSPVAMTGWGSLGELSDVFGTKTLSALKKYQMSVNLPATGYFGPVTRAYVNAALASVRIQ